MAKGLPGIRAEIVRRFFERGVEQRHARAHHERDEGNLKRDVREEHRAQSKFKETHPGPHDAEKQQERRGHDHIRNEHGHVQQTGDDDASRHGVTVQRVAEHRAQQRRDSGAGEGQEQCVSGGVESLAIVEQHAIPFGGEAMPADAVPRGVEREDHYDHDGCVEEDVEQRRGEGEKFCRRLHSNSTSLPFRPANHKPSITTSRLTTAMAAPNGQSPAEPNCC